MTSNHRNNSRESSVDFYTQLLILMENFHLANEQLSKQLSENLSDLQQLSSDTGLTLWVNLLGLYQQLVLVLQEGEIAPPGAWIESTRAGKSLAYRYYRMRWTQENRSMIRSLKNDPDKFREASLSVARRRRLEKLILDIDHLWSQLQQSNFSLSLPSTPSSFDGFFPVEDDNF